MNLLSNAFKFTPDGGSISLSLWTEGDTYGFTVRDSGIGMSPEQLTHIFERFYQVDGQRKGTGIGLSLVKMLVEKHHGTITVASEPAQYTEFKVTLPADMAAFTEKERELPAHESRNILLLLRGASGSWMNISLAMRRLWFQKRNRTTIR